jgi:Homeodomain-like domain
MRQPRGPRPALIQLTDRQRAMLEEIAAGRRRPHDEVQRAAIIVQSADGARTRHLAEVFGVSDPTIRLWRARWVQATPPAGVARYTPPWATRHVHARAAVPNRGGCL